MTETVLEFHPREWVGFLARLEALHRYAAAIGAGEHPLYLTKRDEGIYNFFVVSEQPDLHDFALRVWGSQSIEAVDTPFPDAPERYRFNPKWRIAGDKPFADPKGRGNVFLAIDHVTSKASTWRASAGREAATTSTAFGEWRRRNPNDELAQSVGVVLASMTANYDERAMFWLKTGEWYDRVWATVRGRGTAPLSPHTIETWLDPRGMVTLFSDEGRTLHEIRLSAQTSKAGDAALPLEVRADHWRAAVHILLWQEDLRENWWKCRAHTLRVEVLERGNDPDDAGRRWLRLTLERPYPYPYPNQPTVLLPCRTPNAGHKPTLKGYLATRLSCEFGQALSITETHGELSGHIHNLRRKCPAVKVKDYVCGEQLGLYLQANPDRPLEGRVEWQYSRTLTSETKNGSYIRQPTHARGDVVVGEQYVAEVKAFEQKAGSFCINPEYLDLSIELARIAGARTVTTRWACNAHVMELSSHHAPYRAYIATVNRWVANPLPPRDA